MLSSMLPDNMDCLHVIMDLITAMETAVRIAKLTQPWAEQIRMKVSGTIFTARFPPSNLKKRGPSHPWGKSWPADKKKCTIVLNSTDYHQNHSSVTTIPHKQLKKENHQLPTTTWKGKSCQKSTYNCHYPGHAIPYEPRHHPRSPFENAPSP